MSFTECSNAGVVVPFLQAGRFKPVLFADRPADTSPANIVAFRFAIRAFDHEFCRRMKRVCGFSYVAIVSIGLPSQVVKLRRIEAPRSGSSNLYALIQIPSEIKFKARVRKSPTVERVCPCGPPTLRWSGSPPSLVRRGEKVRAQGHTPRQLESDCSEMRAAGFDDRVGSKGRLASSKAPDVERRNVGLSYQIGPLNFHTGEHRACEPGPYPWSDGSIATAARLT